MVSVAYQVLYPWSIGSIQKDNHLIDNKIILEYLKHSFLRFKSEEATHVDGVSKDRDFECVCDLIYQSLWASGIDLNEDLMSILQAPVGACYSSISEEDIANAFDSLIHNDDLGKIQLNVANKDLKSDLHDDTQEELKDDKDTKESQFDLCSLAIKNMPTSGRSVALELASKRSSNYREKVKIQNIRGFLSSFSSIIFGGASIAFPPLTYVSGGASASGLMFSYHANKNSNKLQATEKGILSTRIKILEDRVEGGLSMESLIDKLIKKRTREQAKGLRDVAKESAGLLASELEVINRKIKLLESGLDDDDKDVDVDEMRKIPGLFKNFGNNLIGDAAENTLALNALDPEKSAEDIEKVIQKNIKELFKPGKRWKSNPFGPSRSQKILKQLREAEGLRALDALTDNEKRSSESSDSSTDSKSGGVITQILAELKSTACPLINEEDFEDPEIMKDLTAHIHYEIMKELGKEFDATKTKETNGTVKYALGSLIASSMSFLTSVFSAVHTSVGIGASLSQGLSFATAVTVSSKAIFAIPLWVTIGIPVLSSVSLVCAYKVFKSGQRLNDLSDISDVLWTRMSEYAEDDKSQEESIEQSLEKEIGGVGERKSSSIESKEGSADSKESGHIKRQDSMREIFGNFVDKEVKRELPEGTSLQL